MNDLYRTNDIGQKCFGQKCRLFDRLFCDQNIFADNFCSIQIMLKNSSLKNPHWSKKVGQNIPAGSCLIPIFQATRWCCCCCGCISLRDLNAVENRDGREDETAVGHESCVGISGLATQTSGYELLRSGVNIIKSRKNN